MTQFYNAVSVGHVLITLTWIQCVYKLYYRRHGELLAQMCVINTVKTEMQAIV
jgi:hypothetical protein